MDFHEGQLVIGTVTSVKPYALFLEFEGNVPGLLHISEISDAFIRDIGKYGSVGDKLKVKIVSIDETNGFLRVSLKKVPSEEAFTSHVDVRSSPIVSEGEFEPLKNKMPEWIENTLNEIDKKG